jgi:hypothetical protein
MATSPYKNVSFYGQGPLNQIQRDYAPSMQMAQQLMANGSNTAPVQSPLEGIARALQGGLGGYTNYATMKAMGDRQTAANDAMIKALSGAKAKEFDRPTPDFVGPMQGSPGGLQGVIDAGVGTGNQDIMPFLQNAQMMKMQQDQAAQQAEIDRRNKLADAMTLKAAPGGKTGSGETWGKTPVWGKGADGQQILGVVSDQGNFKPLDTGSFSPERQGLQKVDLGDRWAWTDSSGLVVKTELKKLAPSQTPENAANVEGAKATAKQAIEQSGKSFESLGKVNQNLANIDSAIAAIDSGAETGPIYKMLPSVTAASVELDNVRNRMGLDVIGSVTFGALSQGELNLALDTALPTGLKPPELRKWLVEKKTAQQKLARYLNEAAIYLGTPGNTPASWAQMQKDKMDAKGGSNGNTGTSTGGASIPPPPPGFK